MSLSHAFRSLIAGIALTSGLVCADEVRVPDDYATIQAAIDALDEGPDPTRTILVAPGTYEENLRLRSNIVLRGEETARTVLKADDPELPTVAITAASDVTLRNFTFTNAPLAVEITDSAAVLIASNVFALDSDEVAVSVPVTSTVNVINNTFHGNATGIERFNVEVVIENNVFSDNVLAIDTDTADNVRFNCFTGNTSDGQRGDSSVADSAALFVDAAKLDFHLRANSPCIDQGTGQDTIDETDADMGAYGGEYADPLPFPVQNVRATDASASAGTPSIDINWPPNAGYLVAGYKVYYDSDASGTPYEGTDGAGGTASSPIDVGNSTSYRLADLSPTETTLDAPTLTALVPGDGRLTASWTAVSGATGYVLRYGEASLDQVIEVGAVTEHTITGLTNGVRYQVAVASRLQPTYYIAVRAYDSTANSDHLSAYSTEASVAVGDDLVSANSTVQTAIAEPVQAYPALPNEGCFIATAAYGHYSAPQVAALREFRDRFLLTHPPGQAFVAWYYANSPQWAQYIAEHPDTRAVVRWLLWPWVILSLALTQSSSAMLAMWAIGLFGLLLVLRARRRRCAGSCL